jgi:hypothetical protein
METESIIQILLLLGLPILWPLLLAYYIAKKASELFNLKRFLLYSVAGYGSIFLFLVLALVFNSWLVSSGHSCNYQETISFKILCSKTFIGFSNWYQAYFIYLPLWVSLILTTIIFKRHASI